MTRTLRRAPLGALILDACDCARCCPGWTVVAMLPSGDVAQVFVSHRTRKGALDAGARWVRAVVGKGWATS